MNKLNRTNRLLQFNLNVMETSGRFQFSPQRNRRLYSVDCGGTAISFSDPEIHFASLCGVFWCFPKFQFWNNLTTRSVFQPLRFNHTTFHSRGSWPSWHGLELKFPFFLKHFLAHVASKVAHFSNAFQTAQCPAAEEDRDNIQSGETTVWKV